MLFSPPLMALRCTSPSQYRLYSSFASTPGTSTGYVPYFLHRGSIGHNRISSSLPHLYLTAANPSQEGIVGAVDAARGTKQQIVESEHLMKALIEQNDGLARRILTKTGLDNTSILQAIDNFIAQQPKVSDTSSPILGSHLSSLLENARKHKKEMGDDFVSVEHLVLAFPSDKRFGKKLFTDLKLSEKSLKDVVQVVCGSQKVTDQNPEGNYEALEKYGNDLTGLARRGKLDPVIGRDDEIWRCIQILSPACLLPPITASPSPAPMSQLM